MAECKLALAFGLDISSSVNAREYRIQLGGLANALRQPEVIAAILTPEDAWIVSAAYEWSGNQQQALIVPWTTLDSPEAIAAFADRLDGHGRSNAEFPTAVGKAVEYGAKLLAQAPPCARRTLDLSGDGENNDGVDPSYFRERGVLDGLTINGLAIQGAYPDPAIYYNREVIQGPNAFLALARDFDDYPAVIIGKLLRELNLELVLGQVP